MDFLDFKTLHGLGHPTAPVRCLLCVNDLFHFYAVATHTIANGFNDETKSYPIYFKHNNNSNNNDN